MTLKDLIESCGFEVQCLPEPEREIEGVYIGDLLSWVMGRAQADNAWITIMSNVNVLAVATLADVSCVILAEGVRLDDELAKTAEAKGVNILCSDEPIYETAVKLYNQII